MYFASFESLEPGMKLGQAVKDPLGRVLLQRGVLLKDNYVGQLRELGYSGVYVLEDEDVGDEVTGLVSQEVKAAATLALKNTMEKVESHTNLSTEKIEGAIQLLLEEVLSAEDVVVAMMDIKGLRDYTFQHCVNVAVLSLVVGRLHGLPKSKLKDLGTGAILHDIGKALLPDDILNKTARLTPGEFAIVQQHTQHGFEILRRIRSLSLLSSHVAFQHHERLDGSGYPRGLKGEEIHLYARIVGICDVFDAITSVRPYKEPEYPANALYYIKENEKVLFEGQLVRLLAQAIAPYPVATRVRLSSGEVSVVVRLNKEDLERPVVRVLTDLRGVKMGGTVIRDLAEERDVKITGPAYWSVR